MNIQGIAKTPDISTASLPGWLLFIILKDRLKMCVQMIVCFLYTHRCVICMMDFVYGDPIRFLPCMHTYHMDCIDDWLMRSFTCPSCMEPVDAALLSSYETN